MQRNNYLLRKDPTIGERRKLWHQWDGGATPKGNTHPFENSIWREKKEEGSSMWWSPQGKKGQQNYKQKEKHSFCDFCSLDNQTIVCSSCSAKSTECCSAQEISKRKSHPTFYRFQVQSRGGVPFQLQSCSSDYSGRFVGLSQWTGRKKGIHTPRRRQLWGSVFVGPFERGLDSELLEFWGLIGHTSRGILLQLHHPFPVSVWAYAKAFLEPRVGVKRVGNSELS